MFIVEMRKKLLTHSSTAKREEKVKERGSCHTLGGTERFNQFFFCRRRFAIAEKIKIGCARPTGNSVGEAVQIVNEKSFEKKRRRK